jgi:HSP20 family protein
MDWDEDEIMGMGDMSMDVYEEGDEVRVKLVAPGFRKDQLDISIESGKITIVGKSEDVIEEREKQRKYYRKEISQRSFTRSCAIPVDVVPDKAKAEFKDGVLMITLPKSESAKPRKIKLDVGE